MKFVRTRSFAKQTMLCAKYNYKMDIVVKKEEAFEDGMNAGLQKKAIEVAKDLLSDGKYTAEEISELLKIPVESFV